MKNVVSRGLTALFILLCLQSVNQVSGQSVTIPYVLGAAYKLSDVQVSSNIDLNAIDIDDVSADIYNIQKNLLKEVLNKSQSDNVLKRLLKKAKRISGDKMVVGVITTVSGDIDQILVAERKYLK
jgi:hypothetical protein